MHHNPHLPILGFGVNRAFARFQDLLEMSNLLANSRFGLPLAGLPDHNMQSDLLLPDTVQ